MGALTTLWLYNNNIGDHGMIAFSSAIASGSLRALRDFYLYSNQIGDEGMKAFSAAISSGSLPSIQELVVDDGLYGVDHPQLKAACQGRGITLG